MRVPRLSTYRLSVGDVMARLLVPRTLNLVIPVHAKAKVIVICSGTRHFTLTVLLFSPLVFLGMSEL